MKALYFDGKSLKISNVQVQKNEGEVLIKVLHAGICNTDKEILKGYANFTGVLGHEFVGIVEEGPEYLLGKRVVGEINISCGECEYCKAGMERHCKNRKVLGIRNKDGVFAEYTTLPAKNLHIVPENVSDIQAVFTEPLAAAVEILEQIKINPTDKVCVIGDGKLGQLVVQVLSLTGCNLTVVGKHQEKLKHLKNRARTLLLEEVTHIEKFDAVVEATGNPAGFEFAKDIIKPKGTIVLKSTYAGNLEADFSKVVVDEINIVGSRCGSFEPALRLLEKKLIDVEYLVSSTYRLEEFEKAFNDKGFKVIFKIGS